MHSRKSAFGQLNTAPTLMKAKQKHQLTHFGFLGLKFFQQQHAALAFLSAPSTRCRGRPTHSTWEKLLACHTTPAPVSLYRKHTTNRRDPCRHLPLKEKWSPDHSLLTPRVWSGQCHVIECPQRWEGEDIQGVRQSRRLRTSKCQGNKARCKPGQGRDWFSVT